MPITLSCAFATSNDSHEHARIAESLGYARAWFYDSPALYPDVWVQLCRAAERTQRIGLGPGVLVPSLRHPMVNAAAISTLAHLAGEERVAIAIGSGFTGRLTMGQRPLSWKFVGEYVRVVKALLAGEVTEWEGRAIQMLHPGGFGAPRPVKVPFIIGAAGPKGLAVAREVGDGVFASAPMPEAGADWMVLLTMGTVLAPGEDPGSVRSLAAAGHAASVRMHWNIEHDPAFDLSGEGNGPDAWTAVYAREPERTRHLAIHDQHLIAVNPRDVPFIDGAMLAKQGLAMDGSGWRARFQAFEAQGVTEVAYQPAGPDIPRELEAMAEAVG
jgi:5,10-methylenetetrahydromethanopterin reductase